MTDDKFNFYLIRKMTLSYSSDPLLDSLSFKKIIRHICGCLRPPVSLTLNSFSFCSYCDTLLTDDCLIYL